MQLFNGGNKKRQVVAYQQAGSPEITHPGQRAQNLEKGTFTLV